MPQVNLPDKSVSLYYFQGRNQDLSQGGKPLSAIIGEEKHRHVINTLKAVAIKILKLFL